MKAVVEEVVVVVISVEAVVEEGGSIDLRNKDHQKKYELFLSFLYFILFR